MKDYETFPPIVVERAKGAYLYDMDGKRYLDAVSSWWVNLFGHSNERLNRALREQAERLEHVIFANFSHPPAIELAEAIVAVAPPGLERVFFADNGSAAVEVALKMCFHYFQQTGHPRKRRFAALTDAYHGETLGALSVGDLDLYSRIYQPLMLDVLKAPGPDCYRCPYDLSREGCPAPCFSSLETLVAAHSEEICGIIVEPLIQCAAGMKIYPPSYLRKLRDLCDRYNIHFIADEIAVGFGRTGRMFACEHAGVSPDLMCLSKGLTAGYLPLSLVVTTEAIYQAFYSDYVELKAFMHSHSYTGNALACAVARSVCGSLPTKTSWRSIDPRRRCSMGWCVPGQRPIPVWANTASWGWWALELTADRASKAPFDWRQRVGYHIYRYALEGGVLLRPLGNVIYFMPPYVVEEEDLAFLADTAFASLDRYFEEGPYR
jgi:adenosylmethionine-8-amino-7-oxononanoate aminotransferase